MRHARTEAAADGAEIVRSNPPQHRLPKHEPRPDPLATACPDDLIDPIPSAEWNLAIVPAIEAGIVTTADRVLAIVRCELRSTWQS